MALCLTLCSFEAGLEKDFKFTDKLNREKVSPVTLDDLNDIINEDLRSFLVNLHDSLKFDSNQVSF